MIVLKWLAIGYLMYWLLPLAMGLFLAALYVITGLIKGVLGHE